MELLYLSALITIQVLFRLSIISCCFCLYFFIRYRSKFQEETNLIVSLIACDLFLEITLFYAVWYCQLFLFLSILFTFQRLIIGMLISLTLYSQLTGRTLLNYKFQLMIGFVISIFLTIIILYILQQEGIRCLVDYKWQYYTSSIFIMMAFIYLTLIVICIRKVRQSKKYGESKFTRLLVYPVIMILYLLAPVLSLIPNDLEELQIIFNFIQLMVAASLGLIDSYAFSRSILQMRQQYIQEKKINDELSMNLPIDSFN